MNNSITPQELTALHERGVHFVLCKPNKVAFVKGWQERAASLAAVRKHHGLLGFIPGRSGLLVVDIDTFPGEDKDATGLVAYEGKGGDRAVGREGELAHDKGYYHSYLGPTGRAHLPASRTSQGAVVPRRNAPKGKYTLRRNMKKRDRDEELHKIQLSISEIDLSISEIEKRVNTFLGYEGPPELPPFFTGKPPPEMKALLNKRTALLTKRTDLEIRRAALVTEGEEEARLADEHNRTQKQDCP